MLVLSREKGERILIGDDITILITEIRFMPGIKPRVRIGIEAPKHIRILREEVYERIQSEGEKYPDAPHINRDRDNARLRAGTGYENQETTPDEEAEPNWPC